MKLVRPATGRAARQSTQTTSRTTSRTSTPRARLLLSALAAMALAATFLVAAPSALVPQAQAHGWVTNPPSRADHCATGSVSFDCGGLQYEPQSVEAPKGSMECSGGSSFTVVDDDSLPWPRTTIGSSTTFRWQLTAMHATSTWEYFVDGQLFKTVDDGGARPGSTVEHTLTGLPAGYHTVFARWNIADTVNAFYQCVDVTVTGSAASGSGADAQGKSQTDSRAGSQAGSSQAGPKLPTLLGTPGALSAV